MQFVHPWFLAASVVLAIPVIIHLFNFRRFKTVYFSNVGFLKEIKQETTSRNKLKHLLVLASRMLAILFLVFAFAQPFIPGLQSNSTAGKKTVSIYIDNSFSMNAVTDKRSLLDQAKLTAKEVVKGYGADDDFQLLTNDFQGHQQRLLNKEEVLTSINNVELSPAVRTLEEISKRQRDAISANNRTNRIAYTLSDFQRNMGQLYLDSSISYNLIPLSAENANNIYVDSVWFSSPLQLADQPVNLFLSLKNSGAEKSENNRLVVKLNGQTKIMNELSIDAGSSRIDTFSFISSQIGVNKLEISISDFPITYDDTYFATFDVVKKMPVLAVNQGRSNQYLDALFKYQPEFDYKSTLENNLSSDSLYYYKLIILHDLPSISAPLAAKLNAYCSNGGCIALFPATNADVESYNRFLNTLNAFSITGISEQPIETGSINLQQQVFKNVFEKIPDNINLPLVKKHYTFSSSSSGNEEVLIKMKNGESLMSRFPLGKGSIFVSAVPLDKDFSELPVHAVFVPLMYQLSFQSTAASEPAYFIGTKTRIEVENMQKNEAGFKISGEGAEIIPEQFAVGNKMLLGLGEQIKKPGFYNIIQSSSNIQQKQIALNYDRRESVIDFIGADELKKIYSAKNVKVVSGSGSEAAAVARELHRGTPLWKWCLIISMIFLAIEIALLRFWKT